MLRAYGILISESMRRVNKSFLSFCDAFNRTAGRRIKLLRDSMLIAATCRSGISIIDHFKRRIYRRHQFSD